MLILVGRLQVQYILKEGAALLKQIWMNKFHLGLRRLLQRKKYIGQIRRLRFSVWRNHAVGCRADNHSIEDISVIRFGENIRDSLIQLVKPNEPVVIAVFQKTVIIVEVASKVFRTDNLDS